VVIGVYNEVICVSSVAIFVLNVNLSCVQCDLLCDRFNYKCEFTVDNSGISQSQVYNCELKLIQTLSHSCFNHGQMCKPNKSLYFDIKLGHKVSLCL